jgi:hypothetical protein
MRKARIRPSRGISGFAMIVGLIMIGVGIKVIIPIFGPIGVIWTLFAVIITLFTAINAFSSRGIASQNIYIEDSSDSRIDQNDMADRLKRLERLRMDGLITEEEYRKKRGEIVNKL